MTTERKTSRTGKGKKPAASEKVEASSDESAGSGEGEPMPEVGVNLRRLRAARGWSLEQLSKGAGVSRAMLSQIELGHSAPTIKLLWKVAHALGVPFSALLSGERSEGETRVLPGERARRLTSHDGRFSTRALFPTDRPRRVEFYELRLAQRGAEDAEPHAPGTVENLVVQRGDVEITVLDVAHRLGPGDAIQFRADGPHRYRNTGTTEAVMYLVMSYAETVGAAPGWGG